MPRKIALVAHRALNRGISPEHNHIYSKEDLKLISSPYFFSDHKGPKPVYLDHNEKRKIGHVTDALWSEPGLATILEAEITDPEVVAQMDAGEFSSTGVSLNIQPHINNTLSGKGRRYTVNEVSITQGEQPYHPSTSIFYKGNVNRFITRCLRCPPSAAAIHEMADTLATTSAAPAATPSEAPAAEKPVAETAPSASASEASKTPAKRDAAGRFTSSGSEPASKRPSVTDFLKGHANEIAKLEMLGRANPEFAKNITGLTSTFDGAIAALKAEQDRLHEAQQAHESELQAYKVSKTRDEARKSINEQADLTAEEKMAFLGQVDAMTTGPEINAVGGTAMVMAKSRRGQAAAVAHQATNNLLATVASYDRGFQRSDPNSAIADVMQQRAAQKREMNVPSSMFAPN